MAHYAFLDEDSIVVEVIVGSDAEGTDWEAHYAAFRGQQCKQTSYNTFGGVHKFDGTALRKNYAGIGYTYDVQRDAFIPPSPYPSWVLNDDTCLWVAPVKMPEDGEQYQWDESAGVWVVAQMAKDAQ
jgi:hypothetical protein